MDTDRSNQAAAFTLLEIMTALAIFAFAIVGVVFLLGTALHSSAETQRDSSLSSALTTAASVVRSYDNLAVPSVLYFDQQGSLVTGTNLSRAYYQFAIASATSAALANTELYSVTASAPYPSRVQVGSFLISRAKK